MTSVEREKLGTLSRYYTREYYEKKTLVEELLIFRWFQLIQERYLIFNVKNYHDCLGGQQIIKPFSSVDNFYGCIVCGKYHLCRLNRTTCPCFIDPHDKHKACAYSGKLLLLQDNLEAIFEDTQYMNKEATSVNGHSPKKSPQKKKPKRLHIQELFKEKVSETVSQSPRTPKRKRTCLAAESIRDQYDLSIDNWSDQEQETEDIKIEVQEDDYDHFFRSEEESEEHILKKARYDEESEEEIALLNLDSQDNDEDYSLEIEGDGGGEEDSTGHTSGNIGEYDNENGEGDYAKNYHNNIRYYNEYYSFLMPVIKKQRQKEVNKMDRYDAFMDLYKRDISKDKCLLYSKEEEPRIKAKLSDNVCKKIVDETRLVVGILLQLDSKRPKSRVIEERLVAYFASLAQNITLLVYQSPIMDKLVMTRSTKNQNQTPKFGISDAPDLPQNTLEQHESTLCPTKIVRALMLHLFLKPFVMKDSRDYSIDIWYKDRWLSDFKGNLCVNYFTHLHRFTREKPCSKQFKKEILKNATLIHDALSFYEFSPLWLREMILNDGNKLILNG